MSITVLMTTYNCVPYISQSIKSVLNQTYKDFEFLIIDDGSTDNTNEIVKSFDDIRIVYKKIEHVGIGAAANLGLKLAKYDWIARMDADDICHPNRLEKQIKFLKSNKYTIVLAYSAYFIKNKILYVTEIGNTSEKIKEQLKLHSVLTHISSIFNKKFILDELNGYNVNLTEYIDYDLWIRSIYKAEFVLVPEVLVFARVREESISNSVLYKNSRSFYHLQNQYFSYESTLPLDLVLKGWREFFYGKPTLVKQYWSKVNFKYWNFRMFLVLPISFLPQRIVDFIKKLRLRLRLKFILNRLGKYSYLKEEFNQILKVVEKND